MQEYALKQVTKKIVAVLVAFLVGASMFMQQAQAAALTSTDVEPASKIVGTTNQVTVSFTTAGAIALDGKIKVTFPSGYNVAGATNGTCTTMDGTFTTGVAGQVVTLTRAGGSLQAAAPETCTINGIVNPTTAGTAGTYTIQTTSSGDVEVDSLSSVAADTFYAASGGASSSSSTTTPPDYSVEVSAPTNEDVYSEGDVVEIDWTSGTNAVIVDIDYTLDGGVTWVSIANNITNNGGYSWMLPEFDANVSMNIRVSSTDLVSTLDASMTDAFEVWDDEATEVVADDDEEGEEESEDEVVVDGVEVGDYIMGASFDTVYYVDEGMVRRPFMNAQTFFTYEGSFDVISEVPDATLAQLPIGIPMLPKAGVVLVKIESDNDVYALEMDGDDTVLRAIASESVAIAMYGANWADYVLDVPSTLFTRFEMGSSITSAESVDMGEMKKRVDLR